MRSPIPDFPISIHALRVEGDRSKRRNSRASTTFLSTPSGWRATGNARSDCIIELYFYPRPPGGGRLRHMRDKHHNKLFLSTPSGWRATSHYGRHKDGQSRFLSTPSGWRATRKVDDGETAERFLSTPSGWRATYDPDTPPTPTKNFYPRPPGGGRLLKLVPMSATERDFYPRPPGGGRQQKRTKFSSVFAQKGEEFASLRHGKRKICRWRFKKDKFWGLIWCEGSGKSVYALASHCG